MNHDAEYVDSEMLFYLNMMLWWCFGLNLQSGADPDLSSLSHSENLISVKVFTASTAVNGSDISICKAMSHVFSSSTFSFDCIGIEHLKNVYYMKLYIY